MQDNIELTWKQRYDRMKKHYGWSDEKISGITGNSPKSTNEVISIRRKDVPGWCKLAIHIFETENNLNSEVIFL